MALQAGRDKILKHYQKTNWISCVASILDPKHKVETFDLSEWGSELKDPSFKYFKKLYKTRYWVPTNVASSKPKEEKKPIGLNFNKPYVQKKPAEEWESEINEYLEFPRADEDTKELDWWRMNSVKFPCLSKMARDIFSVMATSVPVKRFFSIGGNIIDDKKHRMTNQTFKRTVLINCWSKDPEIRREICHVAM